MADRKDRFALISRFKKLCGQHGYQVPQINMNTEQWAADSLIESYSLPLCYELVEYYFSVSGSPSWNKFAQGAGRMLESKQALEADKAFRLEMRQKAQRWLNE
jgi:hypothetical protein